MPSGEVYKEVNGIDGGMEMISWSSVAEMESLTEKYGVSKQTWPVYRDCEVEIEVPLEDAQKRSAELRIALDRVDPGVLQGDYWLSFINRLLNDGNSFFIMM